MAEDGINADPADMNPTSQANGKEENIYSNVIPSGSSERATASKPPGAVKNDRWVSVCLGLLCVLLLALNIGLGIKYIKEKDQLQERSSLVNVSMENINVSATNTNLTRQVEELRITNGQLQTRISKLEKRCPSGWRYFNTKCYLISSSEKTWPEGRQHCIDNGGDLVIINSTEEQVFIHGLGMGLWIGLSNNTSVWKWVDNTQLSTRYWAKGQPGYGNEDCVLSSSHESDPFSSWHDYPCSHKAHFICKLSAYI